MIINLHKMHMVMQLLEDHFIIRLFHLPLCNQTRSTYIQIQCLFVDHRICQHILQCVPIQISVVQRTSKGHKGLLDVFLRNLLGDGFYQRPALLFINHYGGVMVLGMLVPELLLLREVAIISCAVSYLLKSNSRFNYVSH